MGKGINTRSNVPGSEPHADWQQHAAGDVVQFLQWSILITPLFVWPLTQPIRLYRYIRNVIILLCLLF